MIDALHIAASGLRSEQRQIDVISNNVANMNTPGFKRGRVEFVELAAQSQPSSGSGSPGMRGGGTVASGPRMIFSTGDIRNTNNVYDLAIDGAGFFELLAEDGTLVYTRDGRFRLDADGFLVNPQGRGLAVPLQIPSDARDVRIAETGEVSAKLAGEAERVSLGFIELVAFPAEEALRPIGENLFHAGEDAGAPVYGRASEEGMGMLRQGFLEMSNVEMVEEMASLVMAQRAYQLNARVLQASDQVLETINNLRR
ncbi:flagellar hook-basal body protein [Arenimonas terrae]|uniref:Flagellar hook-basal body complex protein n=1 Tax=Arenimonas terrae TaxID=2546226 RepID=A0A5C4RQ11_9GAMM|nr:flagellar hook-basal body complex protein [Arenimonas terrae]TNJ33242.1 flagellar hook-basal body complex protein [Arenimonas terrae]